MDNQQMRFSRCSRLLMTSEKPVARNASVDCSCRRCWCRRSLVNEPDPGWRQRLCRPLKMKDKLQAAFCTHTHNHSLANWDSCPTPAKSEAIEYLQVGPTEIR